MSKFILGQSVTTSTGKLGTIAGFGKTAGSVKVMFDGEGSDYIQGSELKHTTLLRRVNEKLISVLYELLDKHNSNVSGGGGITFNQNDYDWINEDIDILNVSYMGMGPDGDNQVRLNAERKASGDGVMTDLEAYQLIVTRLNNTRIY